jgi:hypothetical protein
MVKSQVLMSFNAFSDIALIILFCTALTLLVVRNRWFLLVTLGVQYIGVFLLVGLTWPLEMAVVKLVTGWITASVLGLGIFNHSNKDEISETVDNSKILFRIFMVILVVLSVFTISPEIAKWLLYASYEQILGSLILIFLGILHLGFSKIPFRVSLGLLTFMAGFEVIYATVETSPVVAGFLSFVSLCIGLMGSYFSSLPLIEVEE